MGAGSRQLPHSRLVIVLSAFGVQQLLAVAKMVFGIWLKQNKISDVVVVAAAAAAAAERFYAQVFSCCLVSAIALLFLMLISPQL